MKRLAVLLALTFAACSGDSVTATERPTNLVVLSGVSSASGITMTLKNAGGPGSYYLEFYASDAPTIYKDGVVPPLDIGPLLGTSSIVSINATYQETLAFIKPAYAVKALSRDDNSAVFRLTSCFILATSKQC